MLSIDTDQDELEAAHDVVKNKHFQVVDTKSRKLTNKVHEIMRMQDFQIETEDKFSETQISSEKRIVTMTIVQIVILSVIGLLQIYALRKVFKEKVWDPLAFN